MIFTVAGSTFSIGSNFSPDIDVLSVADVAGQLWVPVGACETLGAAAETWSTYDSTHLGSTRGTQKKALPSASPMELVCALDSADAGQLAVLSALRSVDAYAFRIDLPDGTARLFLGLVTGMNEMFEGASSVAKMGITIARNTNLVRIVP